MEKGKVRFVRIRGRVVPIRKSEYDRASKNVQAAANKGAKIGAVVGGSIAAAAIVSDAKNLKGQFKTAMNILRRPRLQIVGHEIGALASLKNRVKVAAKAIDPRNKAILKGAAVAGAIGAGWMSLVGYGFGGQIGNAKEVNRIIKKNKSKRT